MTFKEFNEIIIKDKELQKKFEKAKEDLKNEDIKDKYEFLSKAAAKLGYDVKPSEFSLNKISKRQLNDDELEAVAGGKNRVECSDNFEDTDCWFNDYCQFLNEQYMLYTCLYTHDGSCVNEDACYQLYQRYYCHEDYTLPI